MVRGSLTTRAPWRAASSSRWVAYRYSLSNGGSLRIRTMSKADNGMSDGSEASNQSYGSAPGTFSVTAAAKPDTVRSRKTISRASIANS